MCRYVHFDGEQACMCRYSASLGSQGTHVMSKGMSNANDPDPVPMHHMRVSDDLTHLLALDSLCHVLLILSLRFTSTI